VCSIGVNRAADKKLTELSLSRDGQMIQKRMFEFANDSDIERAGVLDQPKCHMTRMPPDLRHIRKKQIGRHRIFYIGNYNQCSYLIFFIKEFKKSGVQDEDDRGFQRLLARHVDEALFRTLTLPEAQEEQESLPNSSGQ
jgi:hypothetical protein